MPPNHRLYCGLLYGNCGTTLSDFLLIQSHDGGPQTHHILNGEPALVGQSHTLCNDIHHVVGFLSSSTSTTAVDNLLP
jgi:hypothetical protein